MKQTQGTHAEEQIVEIRDTLRHNFFTKVLKMNRLSVECDQMPN